MYANELLDAYKKAQNYVQDKQIAHDLNLQANKISKMRKGVRYITDEEAIFLAQGAGIDPEIALLGCHADRNENPSIKAMWANIAKKYNGLGFQGFSTAYAAFMVTKDGQFNHLAECVLSGLMFNLVSYQQLEQTSIFRGLYNEIPRNDEELYIS